MSLSSLVRKSYELQKKQLWVEGVKMGDDDKATTHSNILEVQRLAMERQSTGSPSSATSAFASAAVCAFSGRFKTSRTVHQPEV